MEYYAELYLCHDDYAILDALTTAFDGKTVGSTDLTALTERLERRVP